MQKLLVILSVFFLMQLDGADREITYTVQDSKGKRLLTTERLPLLRDNSQVISAAKKINYCSNRVYSEQDWHTTFAYMISALPVEIKKPILKKLFELDGALQTEESKHSLNARERVRHAIENQEFNHQQFSHASLLRSFYVTQLQRPFSLGKAATDFKMVDILELDHGSQETMLSFQKLLNETGVIYCFCQRSSWASMQHSIVTQQEYQTLNAIAEKYGWDIDHEWFLDPFGLCISCCATIPFCGTMISILVGCLTSPKDCCCISFLMCPNPVVSGHAMKAALSLAGIGVGCLVCGGVCCVANSCGSDCKPFQKLRAITKKKK